ncbi:predicted protein [Plenodomus lingam JN3]|uniref:Predicted protein n=1 Tax=Leptosphaeria maculans (strain JN3 / isolate v23.1.3 / race Av1-4-5-6-7-8) TaxID=985895 RepID=E4ZLV5_LEPMJ|nr:predicted protein [Plenodomus lingam JN3]CBX92785.1 predicted protein [Plenodomus lingam JN3]
MSFTPPAHREHLAFQVFQQRVVLKSSDAELTGLVKVMCDGSAGPGGPNMGQGGPS